MKKEQLEIYTAGIEIELYKNAYDEIKFRNIYWPLVQFQSYCDFNLFWIYSIAPEVVLHIKSIEFLLTFGHTFKRKLSAKEILNCDLIIQLYQPKDFTEFKKHITIFNKKINKN